MDSLLNEVKPMRIPRPKFSCMKDALIYPAEPPKDYLEASDLQQHPLDMPKEPSSEAKKIEELGHSLQKVKV